jgi:uncharacterized protein (DUF1800 family)
MATSLEALTLNRFGFGPRPRDVASVTGNLGSWLKWQLSPPVGDDTKTLSSLALSRLQISYTRTVDNVAVSENRPLNYLYASQADLWKLNNSQTYPDFAERNRPSPEVKAAAFVRAVVSEYQVREALTRFWHNHFSVNADDDGFTAVGFPVYDRIMRDNALGNFRVMLGQVAKSVTMMYYLNQQSSTSSQPNENYAREVMELHTLGIINYYGRSGSNANGYTDDDVIALARALTGWTIATGFITASDGTRPADGRFIFAPTFHDKNPKKVLGLSFDGTTGQAEGEAVLDRLAQHPGTAQFIAGKLCRYFVSDTPSATLVNSIANVWLANVNAPDQIAQVVTAIIYSPEFAASAGAKVKDPFQFITSALRATQAPWSVNTSYINTVNTMGYLLHTWPTPDGIPDTNETWTGANGLLQRWNFAVTMFTNATYSSNNVASMIPSPLPNAFLVADYMAKSYLAYGPSDNSTIALRILAATPNLLGGITSSTTAAEKQRRLGLLMAAVVSLPEFQVT